MPTLLLVLGIALAASLFMSWTVGANSNSAPVAPAVGANAVSTMRAALAVGVVAGLGALLQGGAISETVGRRLVTGTTITPIAAAAALLTAATLITIGNRRGYPIPSAFAVTGAVVGAGVALGGGFAVHEYTVILGFWATIPVVDGLIGYGLARGLRSDAIPEPVAIPLLAGAIGAVLANIRLSVLGSSGSAQGSIARAVATGLGLLPTHVLPGYTAGMVAVSLGFGLLAGLLARWQLVADQRRGMDRFLVFLGFVVVFTSGGTQVGLATGPLEAIFRSDLHVSTIYLLALGSVGILLGAWMGAPKLINAVARDYASLGPRRSIAALTPAFLIAQLAIVLGIPISFNKVMISSIVGAGLAARASDDAGGVSVRKAGITVGAWVGSMVAGGLISFALFNVLVAVPGV